MIIRFHIQDLLANIIIQFFNKYLKCNNKSLSSTSQAR